LNGASFFSLSFPLCRLPPVLAHFYTSDNRRCALSDRSNCLPFFFAPVGQSNLILFIHFLNACQHKKPKAPPTCPPFQNLFYFGIDPLFLCGLPFFFFKPISSFFLSPFPPDDFDSYSRPAGVVPFFGRALEFLSPAFPISLFVFLKFKATPPPSSIASFDIPFPNGKASIISSPTTVQVDGCSFPSCSLVAVALIFPPNPFGSLFIVFFCKSSQGLSSSNALAFPGYSFLSQTPFFSPDLQNLSPAFFFPSFFSRLLFPFLRQISLPGLVPPVLPFSI